MTAANPSPQSTPKTSVKNTNADVVAEIASQKASYADGIVAYALVQNLAYAIACGTDDFARSVYQHAVIVGLAISATTAILALIVWKLRQDAMEADTHPKMKRWLKTVKCASHVAMLIALIIAILGTIATCRLSSKESSSPAIHQQEASHRPNCQM